MHICLCTKRRRNMQQLVSSYQKHLLLKIMEAATTCDLDASPFQCRILNLPCWNLSSTNWSLHALLRGFLPIAFSNVFSELNVPRSSALKVLSAIHNNFIHKLFRRVWCPRTYEKSRWKQSVDITITQKSLPRPSNLPRIAYSPFTTLPPLTQNALSRDADNTWIKNSITQGLNWFNHFSGFMGRLTVLLINRSLCRVGYRS